MGESIKNKIVPLLTAMALCLGLSTAAKGAILLDDYGFNIDGSISYPLFGDPIPAGVNVSGFDDFSGLGTIEVTITGPGAHHFGAFFDHEIDEGNNSFFNEVGAVNGAPAANQDWEIDEPGFGSFSNGSGGVPYFGDIFWNFEDGTLDNQIFFDAIDNQILTVEDDVSMAMSWDFNLADNEFATIMLMLGMTDPGGFSLLHSDLDSNELIYFSGTLDISIIPVPAAVWLFGSALIGLLGYSRRKARS